MEAENLPPEGDTPTIEQQLQQLLDQQAEHRAEVANLRADLAAKTSTGAPPGPSPTAPSVEELQQQRQDQIAEASHYCPGCGRLTNNPAKDCTGDPAAPHPPIEVVSTDEIKADADPANHTAAPATV